MEIFAKHVFISRFKIKFWEDLNECFQNFVVGGTYAGDGIPTFTTVKSIDIASTTTFSLGSIVANSNIKKRQLD